MRRQRWIWGAILWSVGFLGSGGGRGISVATDAPPQDPVTITIPAELRAWLQESPPPSLPPGSYPLETLTAVLPPHAPQWLATEAANGAIPPFEVVASQQYDVPVADHVHQLKATGELDDTSRCGRELPFPGLGPSTDRAGLKALWNLLCRNRGGSFEYLAHGMRGSGPNPHRAFTNNGFFPTKVRKFS